MDRPPALSPDRIAGLRDPVAALLRRVAAEVVMPRFGQLAAEDVHEKTPGELVTVADREAEEHLSAGLTAILAEARVVGEEACAASPVLVDTLASGLVWVVDPIDGTANFAAGRGPFGLMVALLNDGEAIASWIYDPLGDRLCHAARDYGASIDGVPFRARPSGRSKAVASLATQFMTPAVREVLESRARAAYDLAPIPRCAAEHYPRVALGENDVALFQRTLAWDHAPGALFLTEAGGVVRRWDGSPYRVGDGKPGLLVATDADSWAAAYRLFFEQGLPPPPFSG